MLRQIVLPAILSFSLPALSQQATLDIYFDPDKSVLRSADMQRIDSLAEILKSKPGAISIYGHCDANGSDSYNLALSRRRVKAVKTYLVRSGIMADLVRETLGHGESQPVASNETEEGRQQNRRVEIRVDESGLSLKEKIAIGIQPDSTIVLKHINFYGGTHRFLPESQPALDELLEVMRSFPGLVIRVEGHICCEPGDQEGMDNETGLRNLSEARAQAVRNFLYTNEISPDRVAYKGFGHAVPIHPYPEKTEEERTANRRVEIRIISK